MDDDLDLDSFIANIEKTAPEDAANAKLTCLECGGQLNEDEDGNFTCPLCSVQATNILQLDDTELHHDEQGRPVYGQRVRLAEKKSKHSVDYGWSWSTDDAILHILKLQLDALKKARLLSESSCKAVMNMWLKYWLEIVAPYIKDEYEESELLPVSASKALKLRDVEVLVKVKDKVMVPLHLLKGRKDAKVIYRMLGTRFFVPPGSEVPSGDNGDNGIDAVREINMNDQQDDESDESDGADSSISFDVGPHERVPSQLVRELNEILANEPQEVRRPRGRAQRRRPVDELTHEMEIDEDDQERENEPLVTVEHLKDVARHFRHKTKNLSNESITVLTLNRTLAFLEASARCLRCKDPLFAADLIRACNQRLIPFYGSARLMPQNMKFNQRDKLGFQKTRPPTPIQLTRTACLLITNVYKDQLPKKLPVPDLSTILERFIKDMNLPRAILRNLRGQISFYNFQRTRPKIFTKAGGRVLPQYDRWAFAVLVIHLKILFNLSDKQIIAQREAAISAARLRKGGDFFIFHDWVRQMSLRLGFIMRYDPFVLYHPLTEIERMEPTSQLAKYMDLIIEDRVQAEITTKGNSILYDEEARNELADILYRDVPQPAEYKREFSGKDDLHVSKEVKYPLSDALERTQHLWSHQLDSSARDLVFKDFSLKELILVDNLPQWSIYDCGLASKSRAQPKISPLWPDTLKLLLHVGAFLCFCEPDELLDELRSVEEHFYPQTKVIRRINAAKSRSSSPRANGGSARIKPYGSRGCNIKRPY